ncbi:MAG: prolyl aminopeptidase, partial [Eubacteriales bacterium]|nr:prolyl aminopeptidase [Eubacteriales bacterium]
MDQYTEARDKLEVSDFLEVGDGHKLALYRRGNPDGQKVLVLHGGPGGLINAKSLAFFDLYKFDIIAFDQRGCGQSTPFASIEANTINHLVEDIEKIRKFYKIDKWALFGGSFGTTLALAYAIKYPEQVSGMALRGIFLGRPSDIRWLYQEGASYFFPENFKPYRDFLAPEKRQDIVQGYYEIFNSKDQKKISEASLHWANWEMGLVKLRPKTVNFQGEAKPKDISLARLECHYFANNLGWTEENYILDNLAAIKDIKTIIVHGRYDVDCRPSGALELAEKLENVDLYFPLAGHGANDLDYNEALIHAANELLSKGRYRLIKVDHKRFEELKKLSQGSFSLEAELLPSGLAAEDVLIFESQGSFERARVLLRKV